MSSVGLLSPVPCHHHWWPRTINGGGDGGDAAGAFLLNVQGWGKVRHAARLGTSSVGFSLALAPRLFICAEKQGNKLSEANFVPCSDTASY